jgi:hypothetical protein
MPTEAPNTLQAEPRPLSLWEHWLMQPWLQRPWSHWLLQLLRLVRPKEQWPLSP